MLRHEFDHRSDALHVRTGPFRQLGNQVLISLFHLLGLTQSKVASEALENNLLIRSLVHEGDSLNCGLRQVFDQLGIRLHHTARNDHARRLERNRSEERRVGNEWRYGWARSQWTDVEL